MARAWTDVEQQRVVELVTLLSEVLGDDRLASVIERLGIDLDEDVDGAAMLRDASASAEALNPFELVLFGVAVMRHSLDALERDPGEFNFSPEMCYEPPPPPETAWYYSWGGQRYRTCNHIPSHSARA